MGWDVCVQGASTGHPGPSIVVQQFIGCHGYLLLVYFSPMAYLVIVVITVCYMPLTDKNQQAKMRNVYV